MGDSQSVDLQRPPEIVRFGSFRFDRRSSELRHGDAVVTLPPRAAALLIHFVEHAGELVTKDALVAAAWPETVVSDASLKEAIHVLRQALGDDPARPRYIRTVPRRGYRFVAELVAEVDDERPSRRRSWRAVVAFAAIVIAALIFASWPRAPAPSTVRTVRFDLHLPESVALTPGPANLAFSAAGDLLALVAKAKDGPRRLYLRRIEHFETVELAGTEGAAGPFFSPDRRRLGYFTSKGLYQVAVDGGPPRRLVEVEDGLAGSWSEDGDVVFCTLASRGDAGLWRLEGGGGTPQPLTELRPGELAHRWPLHLPGGRWLVFTVHDAEATRLELLDVGTGDRRTLVVGASSPAYVHGKLVYARGGNIEVATFDPGSSELGDVVVSAVEKVLRSPVFGTAHFAVSATGHLAYVEEPRDGGTILARRRADSELERLPLAAREFHDLARSPGGDRLALVIRGPEGFDLWILTLATTTLSRLTFDGSSLAPVWSPDGRSVIYLSRHPNGHALYSRPADGSGQTEVVLADSRLIVPTSWTASGLIYAREDPENGWDVRLLDPDALTEDGTGADRKLLAGRFDEQRAVLSPNGRFLAYESNESEQLEVYLRPWPDLDEGKWQISTAGGTRPSWSADGRRVFFRRGGQVWAARVYPEPGVEPPVAMFDTADVMGHSLAAVESGYVTIEVAERSGFDRVRIVIDWLAELDRRP